MGSIRTFLGRHLGVFALVLAFALAMKAFVPVGFMIGTGEGHVLTVEICDGQGHTGLRRIAIAGRIAIPEKPGSGDHDPQPAKAAKAAKDCPFTALSGHALSGADPLLLALALAFVLALGFLAVPPLRLTPARYRRPPLRGPPILS